MAKHVYLLFINLLLAGINLSCSKDNSDSQQPNVPEKLEVTIGTQTWMTKNLDVDHYRNGDPIPEVIDREQWENLTTGAWCYYNNDSANGAVYGKLYNWYALTDPRGLAPDGWHIPNDGDWDTLMESLGGYDVAGGKMKSTSLWSSPNSAATNSSGFNGLPGGLLDIYSFHEMGFDAYWWSSTLNDSNYYNLSHGYLLQNDSASLLSINNDFHRGISVRCIKDGSLSLPMISTATVLSDQDISKAHSGGTIVNDGGGDIITKGIVWSTSNSSPTIDLATKTNQGAGSSDFNSLMDNLAPNTQYFVRAYATNSVGTAYGKLEHYLTPDIQIQTVTIGSQTWMLKNLNVDHYRNGDPIEHIPHRSQMYNLATGAWIYSFDRSYNGYIYGKLYNWSAVNDPRGLAPVGFHIPTQEEWQTLIDYLGGDEVAGGALKEQGTYGWRSPNTGATNSSGFTARGGDGGGSGFPGEGYVGCWWTTTENDNMNAWGIYMETYGKYISMRNKSKKNVMSVRCIKD